MIVKTLYLKNYRCFGDKPVKIEFSKTGLSALIGPNNVGKSTVLKALDILLGDKWPSGQFNEDDFHNCNPSNPIILACEFDDYIQIHVKENIYSVIGLVVFAKHIPTEIGENSVNIEYRLLGSSRNLEQLDFDNLDIICYGHSTNSVFINQEIRNQLPIVIVTPLTKLASEQPTNKWSVLGRMLQKVETQFLNDSTQVEQFKEKIREAVTMLRTPESFVRLEASIKEYWDKAKPKNISGTEIKFTDYDPWHYYRQLKLAIQKHGDDVPIETLGEGVQRLAIIALYRTYLKYHGRNAKAILLVEEPESYLHPQARNVLFDVLKEAILGESGTEGQIIYTTHSEDFIDCGQFENIIMFADTTDSVEVRHISEEILKNHTLSFGHISGTLDDQQIYYRMVESITHGLKEALFASKAVIVEGPIDAELFTQFTDVKKEQISIVYVNGKNNIPSVYAFLTAFGVPCLVVVDRDSREHPANGDGNQVVAQLLSQQNAKQTDQTTVLVTAMEINDVSDGDLHINGRLLVFGKNLESVLRRNIISYSDLITKVRLVFGISGNKSPRDYVALKIAYSGDSRGNDDLQEKVNKSKDSIQLFIERLNVFIKQEVIRPSILSPRTTFDSVQEVDDIPF